MADPTIRQLYNTGGCHWIYVWHVCGYPWAVCTDPDLIPLLQAPASVADAAYLRTKMFGEASFGAIVPAYDVPVFPTLDPSGFGSQNISVSESNGMINIGSSRIVIFDEDLGHTWDHAVSGDTIWGLEGLHRVVDIFQSSVNGWGYLTNTCGSGDASLEISEETGSRLKDRLDALSGNEYAVIWCNHEAIAAGGTTGSGTEYTINFAQSTTLRGLYNSRPQNHHTAFITDLNPVVSDVPGSIAGHYCYLYGIPIKPDGTLYHDTDGNPLVSVESHGTGVVSTNIETEDRKTTIQINPITSALKQPLKMNRVYRTDTHLKNYVFTRTEDSGVTPTDVEKNWQCPHLVIREFIDVSGYATHEKEAAANHADEFDQRYWDARAVWICAPGETRTFDSPQEVAAALNTELQLCADNDPMQRSGSAAGGFTDIYRPLVVEENNGGFNIRYVDESVYGFISYSSHSVPVYSLIHGPLAYVLGLGRPCTWAADYDYIFKNQYGKIRDGNNLAFELVRNKLNEFSFEEPDVWGWKLINTDSILNRDNRYVSQYYYQWLEDGDTGFVTSNELTDQLERFVPPKSEDGTRRLWIAGTDTDLYDSGESIDFGDKYATTVDSLSTSTLSENLSLEYTGQIESVNNNKTWLGNSLTYIPMAQLVDYIDYDSFSESADDEFRNFNIDKSDPYMISSTIDFTDEDNLSDLIRSFLNESIVGITVPAKITLSHVPFFTTTGGRNSFINWDSFDAVFRSMGDWHYYHLPQEEEINLWDILRNETLFHQAMMTWQWDDSINQFVIGFRRMGPASFGVARNSGKYITESKYFGGAPSERQHDNRIVTDIEFDLHTDYVAPSLVTTMDPEISGHRSKYKLVNHSLFSAINSDNQTLKIKPIVSRADIVSFDNNVRKDWQNILYFLSRAGVTQSLPITLSGRFNAEPGTEALLTHSYATHPSTHQRGIDSEPVFVLSQNYDLSRCKGRIVYRLSNSESYTYTVAPACMIESGNFTLHGTYLEGTPNDHEYSHERQVKDLYWFDCYDMADISNPTPRTSCGCGDYAVYVVQRNERSFTPIAGTCEVFTDSGVDKLRVTCTTSTLSTASDIIVFFGKFDVVEECQKHWIYFADDNNTIGTSNRVASRWV